MDPISGSVSEDLRSPISGCLCIHVFVFVCSRSRTVRCIHHDKPADSVTVTCNHTSLRFKGLQSENEWWFIVMKTSYIFVSVFNFTLLPCLIFGTELHLFFFFFCNPRFGRL